MCLLTVALPGSSHHRADLLLAGTNNPDGFGYAVHAGSRIITGRGMVAEEVIDRYLIDRTRFPDGPALFHARLATHGAENVKNCHPFRVGGDRRIVLAHNGILPITMPKREHRSDTRLYAEEHLPKIGVEALDDPAWTKTTEEWLGANKVAILSASPKLAKSLYLLNDELGEWQDGIWWSNDSYRTTYAPWPSYGTVAELIDICEMCGEPVTQAALESDICERCNSCLWCGDPADECLCQSSERGGSDNADTPWWLESANDEVSVV